MDYCSCGLVAVARCPIGGEFICQTHQYMNPNYSESGADSKERAAGNPLAEALRHAWQVAPGGPICGTCYAAQVSVVAAAGAQAMLGANPLDSVQIALLLLRSGNWDHRWYRGPTGEAFGAQVLFMYNGERPRWAALCSTHTASLLLVELANRLGQSAPRRDVYHIERHRGFFGGTHEKYAAATTIEGWAIPYFSNGEDGYQDPELGFVGRNGAVSNRSRMKQRGPGSKPDVSRETYLGTGNDDYQKLAELLAGKPQDYCTGWPGCPSDVGFLGGICRRMSGLVSRA